MAKQRKEPEDRLIYPITIKVTEEMYDDLMNIITYTLPEETISTYVRKLIKEGIERDDDRPKEHWTNFAPKASTDSE